ncbi:MAG TPA: tRNA glutamyl-Q(34) synthetase GluQRS [Candidatus Avipropionibacterium avicola]|uniref:Glutamyl-Q tRNA(Asp) synthetase n=1 Tax=Candidatus Avipropionibacterium avicola TaxID=2840701 RepID=A0A9D1KMF2_9ACTN|nr:tRNA glutamyl-Q(34) synthetase GluQRS [Candidatus Avipropionibacterium avicola]
MTGAGRYAPSPSGDLHVGNLRTAVVAWLLARSTGRRFLLRIEDLDRDRSSTAVAERQIADLLALGLDFDEPRWVQSERLERHAAAITALGPERTYECYCTRREVAEAVRAPHQPPGAYPGTCAELTEQQRQRRRRERPPALRVRAGGAEQTVTDLWHGPVTAVVDDFVLRRNDGTPAYNLAVVVDDAESGVDQVVRGDDLLDSSPRQAWLAGELGWPAPTYGHVPLVLNGEGRRLAKRDGAVTLAELAAHGMGADQVLTRIAISLELATEGEPVTMAELRQRWDPARLPRTPWVLTGGLR